MEKKFLLILILLSLVSSVYAVSWSAEIGTGYRACTDMKVSELRFIDAGITAGSFSLYYRNHYGYVNDLSAEYRLECGRFFSSRFMAHSQYVSGSGGFSDIGMAACLGFDYKYAGFDVSFGVQWGIAYSEYSSGVVNSLSPIVSAGISAYLGAVNMRVYMDMASRYEHQWKAWPLFGLSAEVFASTHISVCADIYVQSVQFLMDPFFTPNSSALRISYKYRAE